jgi:hypothetical protein
MWRSGVSAVEAVGSLPDSLNSGLNFSGYDTAMFMIYPSGGALPTIEIMVWDPLGTAWISASPPATFTAAVANVPFTVTVPAHGRGLYVRVSVLGAGEVSIASAGHTTGGW